MSLRCLAISFEISGRIRLFGVLRTAPGGKDLKDLGDCFERMWPRIDDSQKLQYVLTVEATVYDPNSPHRNPLQIH